MTEDEIFDRIEDLSTELGSDRALLSRATGLKPRLSPRFLIPAAQSGRPLVVHLNRCALDLAYRAALGERQNQPSLWADQFEQIDHAARQLEWALRAFFRTVDARSADPVWCESNPRWLSVSLCSFGSGLRPSSIAALDAASEEAEADAEALKRSLDAIERVTERAPRKAARARQSRELGKRDEQEFGFALAELWVHITGQRPGTAEQPEKNPFLRYFESAWTDVFGYGDDTRDFIGALRFARRRLTDERISYLRDNCPERMIFF